jgi:hypothetical protein
VLPLRSKLTLLWKTTLLNRCEWRLSVGNNILTVMRQPSAFFCRI